ncbi:hypothetical protein [Nocardia sp. NPDC057668]|uniref:hypothetical protein n=1 Tax=Nocardia sp. NPDC057668 TaxID=3346202 RepID=UPI0036702070
MTDTTVSEAAPLTGEAGTPPTLLDGVNWPGFALLLAGVLTLAWTLAGSGGWPVMRSAVIAAAFSAGIAWITVEHIRFRGRRS